MQSLDDWLTFISNQHAQTIDMGLSRMQVMLERLDLQQPAPRVITVAGTNGKGSTCLACEALLSTRNLSVGTTLSPHIHRFNERIRIDGEPLSDDLICLAFAAIEVERGEIGLTYFEFAALAALWSFQSHDVDVAVLEIGLGGRLDAFNTIDADVGIITSIGLDHQDYLGTSLDEIGTEKAGILRAGQHVVLGPDMPGSVLAACDALSVVPLQIGATVQIEHNSTALSWRVEEDGEMLVTDMRYGSCAPQNLVLAYLGARYLEPLGAASLQHVSARLQLPGRMQEVQGNGRKWLLDVAHNPAGVEFLITALAHRGLSPKLIVCGMLKDKQHQAVITTLAKSVTAAWWFVDTEGERGLSGQALLEKVQQAEHPPQDCTLNTGSWSTLLREVDSACAVGDVILVFGSFNIIEQFDQVDFDQPV